MKTGSGFALALAALALATGCQKAQEKAQETAMEAAIEQATGNKVDIEKDGNAVSIKTNEGDIKIASAAEGGTVALPDGFPGDLHLPAQRRIENRQAIGAEDHDDPSAILPEIVDPLDQGVYSHLVLMVAVILRAGCR